MLIKIPLINRDTLIGIVTILLVILLLLNEVPTGSDSLSAVGHSAFKLLPKNPFLVDIMRGRRREGGVLCGMHPNGQAVFPVRWWLRGLSAWTCNKIDSAPGLN